MKRLLSALATAALCAALAAPAAGAASFGLSELDVTFTDQEGAPSLQAGSHPFAYITSFAVNTEGSGSEAVPVGEAKDVIAIAPPGLTGTPTPGPRCSNFDFVRGQCDPASALGVADVEVGEPGLLFHPNIYNLIPPPGAAVKLGFLASGIPVTVEANVNPDPPYNLIASGTDILSQVLSFYRARLTLWGVPGRPRPRRRALPRNPPSCEGGSAVPFLTLPTRCAGPLAFAFEADSWQQPGAWVTPPPVAHPRRRRTARPARHLGLRGARLRAADRRPRRPPGGLLAHRAWTSTSTSKTKA